MSFPSLFNFKHAPINDTTIPGIAHLPTSILDAFIPGYSFISKYVLDVFGFDISIIVSILVLGFACTTGVHYIYRHLWASFLTHCTASVVIDAYDIIYDNLLSWAAEQKELKQVRSLKAQSADYTDDVDELRGDDGAVDGAIFNFNSWAAKVPPRYEPDTGYHWFRHKGHWFKFSREKNKVQGGWMGMMIQDQETVRLTVLGRSTQPIKELILDTRDRTLAKQTARTTVRRPSPKEQRGRGRQAWNKVAVRPSRPMGTVVLESNQKAAILRDINDFLDPATSRWYSNRGLAYRRGYLLSGPPGTGKTSLSFALAGVFGLDIYCMSLSEKTLSEEDLILLFNSLPKRCIVLLEDIDSAGVTRKKPEAQKEEGEKSNNESKDEKKDQKDGSTPADKEETTETTAAIIAKEVTKAVKAANESSDRSTGPRSGAGNDTGITMSGLLNAIDGVASQEGRVLIMTTNFPEKLDDALIRPGRVDMKIEFALASKQQIRELFLRMYCVDSRETARLPTNLKQIMPDVLENGVPAELSAAISDKGNHEKREAMIHQRAKGLPTPPRTPMITAPTRTLSSNAGGPRGSFPLDSGFSLQSRPTPELEKLADTFAERLPDGIFSPAEVQGYLIMRKKDPHKAVNEIDAWRDAEIANKEKRKLDGSKVKKAGKGKGEEEGEGRKGDKKDEGVVGVGVGGGADGSNNSSTDDLVKIKKGDADADCEGRGGEGEGVEYRGDHEEEMKSGEFEHTAVSANNSAAPETGIGALFGNIQGVSEADDGEDAQGTDGSGSDDDNNDEDDENRSSSDGGSSSSNDSSHGGDDGQN